MTAKIYDIRNLRVDQKSICFELAGTTIQVSLAKAGSKILPHAKPEYARIFEIDEDGIGIHWPLLDEDLSVAGLLRAAGREDLVIKQIPSVYLEEAPTQAAARPKRNPSRMLKNEQKLLV